MNQLFQQINQSSGKQLQSNPTMNFLKQKYKEYRFASNPVAYMNGMIQSNPQMQQVMNMAQQNGGDMKQLFYKLAESKGVDPNSVLELFK